MQRSLLVALVVLLVAVAGATWWFLGAPPAPPVTPGGGTSQAPVDPAAGAQGGDLGERPDGRIERQAVELGRNRDLGDPEIRASLCGFKGRVVDHQKRPVPESGLRMYRGALDSVLTAEFDPFAAEPAYTPDYIAGDTTTDAEGRWQVTGVWPRGFYMLHAGIGTDSPTWQIVTRTPAPGEVIDLGDIVLPHAGVITGIVLDDNGDPMPGALVRCADLPGALAAFFPIERFDPKGALLVREKQFPMRVIEAPAWVEPAFEQLPFPRAISDAEGRFRLVGVVPGSNMLATTAPEYLSDVRPSVVVRPGQVKDVGSIRMKRGEELLGVVEDAAGKPVVDAEVFAGSVLAFGPVDLAQRLGRTDAQGRFSGQGFSAGNVSVAARRGKGHAWVLAEPQSILGEVKVVLPASYGVEVAVLLADGKPAKSPRFQLLQGKAGQGAAEMFLLGVAPPLDLRERKRDVAEGRWRIENLNAGAYTLIVDAPGHANSFASFEIVDQDTKVAVQLAPPMLFTVQVIDFEDKPVRNAAIYAQARGKSMIDMPVRCGRTDAEGKLVVDELVADMLRVSAEHPKFGTVHGEVKAGETVVMRMLAPGAMHVVLTENRKPPEPGKWSVGVMRRRSGNEVRGPLENMPALHTADLAGELRLQGLQPGEYEVNVVKALDALRSPGGVMALAQEMFLSRNLPSQRAEVQSGAVAEVALELGEQPLEGPKARLSGSVTVDGKVAAGYALTTSGFVGKDDKREWRRFSTRVDQRGRFDFGDVPAGELQISLLPNAEGMIFAGPGQSLWGTSIKLEENESRELTIDVLTTSIRGVCYLPDGKPAAGVFVSGDGLPKNSIGEHMRVNSPTDSRGEFHFPQVVEGKWTFTARGTGQVSASGELKDLEVAAGVPLTGLRIDLQTLATVAGKVELAGLGTTKPRFAWLSFERIEADANVTEASGPRRSGGSRVNTDNGEFRATSLTPGRYKTVLFATFDGEGRRGEQQEYSCGELEVTVAGGENVVLRPGERVQR